MTKLVGSDERDPRAAFGRNSRARPLELMLGTVRSFSPRRARRGFGATRTAEVPVAAKFRAARTAAKISLTTVSTELGTAPLSISRLERGFDHDREFAKQY
ncbi:MAG TPA: hypothetical protein VMU99_00165 [Acidimicrobiales bacterium]|nr:hypothetical protein [Acidimicrobiales bacterium]